MSSIVPNTPMFHCKYVASGLIRLSFFFFFLSLLFSSVFSPPPSFFSLFSSSRHCNCYYLILFFPSFISFLSYFSLLHFHCHTFHVIAIAYLKLHVNYCIDNCVSQGASVRLLRITCIKPKSKTWRFEKR